MAILRLAVLQQTQKSDSCGMTGKRLPTAASGILNRAGELEKLKVHRHALGLLHPSVLGHKQDIYANHIQIF